MKYCVLASLRFPVLAAIVGMLSLAIYPAPAALAQTENAAQIHLMKSWNILRSMQHAAMKNDESSAPADTSITAGLPVDSDDDGMPNAWETSNGLNPYFPNDAWTDLDGDQVVNLFEHQLGSNPRNASTPPIVTVGLSGAMFNKLGTAIDAAPKGSVIRVAAGTYWVNYITFSPKVVMIQGGWNANFTQRNLILFPTVLNGGNKDEVLYFSFSSGYNAVILDGLKLVWGKGYFGALNLLAEGTALLKASIFNCFILRSTSTSSYGGVLRMNNWDTSASDRTIANTVIANNFGSGIYAQVTESAVARWRILHTAIYNNSKTIDNGDGIESFTLDNAWLRAHVFNSIIWGNKRNDINLSWNIIFNVDHTDINRILAEYGAQCKMGAGNLNTGPGFINPANDNFHLINLSPLKNRGISKGIPTRDFEGDNRVIGAAPDIGPDEIR